MNIRLLEAAERPQTPSWQLGLMTFCHSDPHIAAALAQNPNTPKWSRSWLSLHPSPTVRQAVAGFCGLGNRFLSMKARHRLLNDDNPEVEDRANLAYRGEWPPGFLKDPFQVKSPVFG